MQSYGNYEPNNKGFAAATAYGNTMADGESAYYMVPYALENSGLSTYSAVISHKMGIYAIPYYTISGAATQTSDVVVEGNAQYSYTAHYYYWSGISGVVLPSKYKTYESEYAQFVKDNYLDIDDDTLAFMNTIIAEKKFLATDREIISKVAKYIQTAATYNLEYDVELDEESNFVTAFLSKYKEGVCRHYAAAATMLYRALGIPARYTEGFVAETKSGTVVDVTAAQAHAWVEVYINGIGWVNVEVTGSSSNQTQTKTKLTISPVDTRALYQEGVTLSASNTVTGFTISKDGYTYVATISGSVQGLGMVMSEIVDFEIYTSSGELVYKKSEKLGEDKFEIIYTKGIVQQYLSKLTFTSNSKEELYNGNSVDTALEDCSLVSGDLFSELGYTCVITPTGSVTLAGSAASTFSVTIYKNGVDCTSHFWVNKTYGTLTLTARELTVYAGSDEKPFDGTVLTCDSIIYDELQLAEGDYIADYVIEGSQKNIGSSSNVLKSVKILNQNGQNVTSNYTITIRDGLLTVTVPA